MSELIKVAYNRERPTTSARDLWVFLDRPHGEFMKWFTRYVEYGFTENMDFRVIDRSVENPQGGRPANDYEITLDMAKELAMLQKSEKGKIARQYFIELEKHWNSSEAIMARALKMADSKINDLEQQLEQERPKITFANAVAAARNSILIGDLAKIIRQNGYDIGQKRLFEYLRDRGFLMKSGSSRNMPTQRAMDMGLFEIKERTIDTPDGSVKIIKTTKVTGKGQIYFINQFLSPNSGQVSDLSVS